MPYSRLLGAAKTKSDSPRPQRLDYLIFEARWCWNVEM